MITTVNTYSRLYWLLLTFEVCQSLDTIRNLQGLMMHPNPWDCTIRPQMANGLLFFHAFTGCEGFKRSSRPELCWSTWALHMTPSGRLGSWWSYQKPSSAEQQSDSSPALLASETFGYSSATKSAESVSWRTVFPKDPYLRRRSLTYTSVTSLQPSRWSLDMLMTGSSPHNQRHFHILRVHCLVISDTWTSTLTTGSCA